MNGADEAQDRAARWVIAQEQDDWSAADQAALDAWLAASDINKAAYWRLDHSWREADRIGALGGHLRLQEEESSRYRGARWWAPIAVAASIVAIASVGYHRMPNVPSSPQAVVMAKYDTGVGGHRTVGLPYGSLIELNTASVVRTAIHDAAREAWLDQGEAYFEVAHSKGRPFLVHAGTRLVTVLGTKFSVRRDGDKVTISVLEGRVRVDDLESGNGIRPTIIAGGTIALTEGSATLVTQSEEHVEDALAWREGLLSFDRSSLADVAAEFNRYNKKQILVADPEAASIRIGGIFPAAKPDTFVRLLRDAYGLSVEETPGVVRISNKELQREDASLS